MMVFFPLICVVLFNHLGLCEAAERVLHYKFKILNCSKCGTFWATLTTLLVGGTSVLESVTLSFVMAYLALWLELLLAVMSRCYERLYDKISEADAHEAEATNKD